MARWRGTESILAAAAEWQDRCLVNDGSVFSGETLWRADALQEVFVHFVQHPDEGDRSFLDKLHDQLAPASNIAKRLTAEMLWVMFLFPSNLGRARKLEVVSTIWSWSGDTLPQNHPALDALGDGIGSGGMGYNNYRPYELEFFTRFVQAFKARAPEERRRITAEAWGFAQFVDSIEGADRRQFRHMLLHLLHPDTFERVSSKSDKSQIDTAFGHLLADVQLTSEERSGTSIARDRRLLRIREELQRQNPDAVVDFYVRPFMERWRPDSTPAQSQPQGPVIGEPSAPAYPKPETRLPELATIAESIRSAGLVISDRILRRYHLSLHSRSFVILSGISGSGKTWLAEEYARASNARLLVVPVAPNWTTNEDLLGYVDPFTKEYRDTAFSRFVREASVEWESAKREGREPRDFHLVLDEMNLARLEYYFALFLSRMEQRARDGKADLELGSDSVQLAPNLRFVGTVNIDETTHGFADKVYDRAQLVELEAPRDALKDHVGSTPYAGFVLQVWDILADVAPFAFRVLDDISAYVDSAAVMNLRWEELLDELMLQKILPKIRGTDPRVGDALTALAALTGEAFPLTHSKVVSMRARFEQTGVASYF